MDGMNWSGAAELERIRGERAGVFAHGRYGPAGRVPVSAFPFPLSAFRFPLLPLLLTATCSAAAGALDFNKEVRPILNQHCTTCHGGVKQASNVSFIYREQAVGRGKSGKTIIVPGHPENSELIRRVTSQDPEERMPPATHGDGKPLAAQEIEKLRQWITDGAAWGEHWAYRRPQTQAAPRVQNRPWLRRPLDQFVLSRLESEGMKPSPEASRAQWLRRATLDLTGLAPTMDQLSAFARDASPNAYEKVVDRLLASQHFGERWGALWMDLARYADTQGYEKDNNRDMWPYRDWLIRAFNSDLPFDQFTIKQLAGDLLPDATIDDQVATGFHRNTQTNTEGGTDDEEFRLIAVIDRINTTWTVWQATTFGCTQCHSHPYEPFRQEEYYRFMTFFNSTEDADLGDDFPRLNVPTDPQRLSQAEHLDHEIRQLREQLNDAGRTLAQQVDWKPAVLGPISGAPNARFSITGHEVVVDGTVGNGTEYVIPLQAGEFTALRLDILPRKNDPKSWPENGAVVSYLWLERDAMPAPGNSTAAAASSDSAPKTEQPAAGGTPPSTGTDSATTGKVAEPKPGEAPAAPASSARRIEFAAVYADILTGPFDPEESLKPGRDGGGAFPKLFGPRWLVFAAKEPVRVPEGAVLRVHLKHDISDAETKGSILYHFKLSVSDDPGWTQLVSSPERRQARQRWEAARKERKAIASASTLVMQERPPGARRETRLFVRGNFLAKDKVVEPGVPQLFRPLSSGDRGADRLAMARWLVSPDNPLTARVMVNRVWAELFGIGLVETVEDFGSTGLPPSDQALLDDLALRFQNEHHWSLKALLRGIVLSATYRQDHSASPALLAKDPRNRLFGRGPRTRLTAEMVRDQALDAAGLLSQKIGGPSVMPPQPDGVWQVVYNGANWETAKGEDRYRRGLYTYWRRTSPYPSFMTFDASSREVCTARRLVTNTPLQALVGLNDPVYFEAAQGLARRMQKEGGTDLERRLVWAMRLLITDDPPVVDISRLRRLYEAARGRYQADPTLAGQAGGDADTAALTLVASTILNLDETLTK